jgi:hypothetical protein
MPPFAVMVAAVIVSVGAVATKVEAVAVEGLVNVICPEDDSPAFWAVVTMPPLTKAAKSPPTKPIFTTPVFEIKTVPAYDLASRLETCAFIGDASEAPMLPEAIIRRLVAVIVPADWT